MSCDSRKKELKKLFEKGEEGILVFNKPSTRIENVVLDFDGVILRECGFAEIAYNWLIQSMKRKTFIDYSEVLPFDAETIGKYRHMVKGKAPYQKIKELKQIIFGSEGEEEDEKSVFSDTKKVVLQWFGVNRYEIVKKYGHCPENYLLPGGKELVLKSSENFKVFGLTANTQDQAEWLMDFGGLKNKFIRIIGFSEEELKDGEKVKSKVDLMKLLDIKKSSICVIGDGYTDIIAGKQNGTYTFGIANDYENGVKLIENGCDAIATSSSCFEEIIRVLKLE